VAGREAARAGATLAADVRKMGDKVFIAVDEGEVGCPSPSRSAIFTTLCGPLGVP